jgi:hypothetical protein
MYCGKYRDKKQNLAGKPNIETGQDVGSPKNIFEEKTTCCLHSNKTKTGY